MQPSWRSPPRQCTLPNPGRFKGRIGSIDALRDAVLRRNDFLSPKMTPQEVEDVVAYLNATYYRFSVK